MFAALVLAGAARIGGATTWTASPDGKGGDGSVETILPSLATGDTLILLGGKHRWPANYVSLPSLSLVGDGDAYVTGENVLFLSPGNLIIRGINFSGLLSQLSVVGADSVRITDVRYEGCSAQMRVSARYLEVADSHFAGNTLGSDRHDAAGLTVNDGIVVVSDCVFSGNLTNAGHEYDEFAAGGGAVRLTSRVDAATITGCVFAHNTAVSGSALHSQAGELTFTENTVFQNDCRSGAVVVHSLGFEHGSTRISHNVFAGNSAYALWVGDGSNSLVEVTCNAFWENNDLDLGDFFQREKAQWRAMAALGHEKQDEGFYSVFADPMFCDSLYVHRDSKLANQNDPCRPIGGARGLGCVLSPTLETSWGELKKRLGAR